MMPPWFNYYLELNKPQDLWPDFD